MLSDAIRDCLLGIDIRHWSEKKLFNLKRLQAATNVKENVIRDFLFAAHSRHDCALNAGDKQEMQLQMDRFSSACDNLRQLMRQLMVLPSATGRPR